MHKKENNIRNFFRALMFQQLLANKHHRLRDSVPITIWPSGGLVLVTDKKKKTEKNNKSRVKQEPRSAHGRTVNNYCLLVHVHENDLQLQFFKCTDSTADLRGLRGHSFPFLL